MNKKLIQGSHNRIRNLRLESELDASSIENAKMDDQLEKNPPDKDFSLIGNFATVLQLFFPSRVSVILHV